METSVLFIEHGTGKQIAHVRMSCVPSEGELILIGTKFESPDIMRKARVELVIWLLHTDCPVCNFAQVEIVFDPKRDQALARRSGKIKKRR